MKPFSPFIVVLISLFTLIKTFCARRSSLKKFLKKSRYFMLRLASFAFGPYLDPRPKMLGYHTVSGAKNDLSVTPQQLAGQLDWLIKKQFHILTFNQYWEKIQSKTAIPARTVVISFDDGFRDVLIHAAPCFAARGLAATLFVVTGFVGGTNAYDQFLGTVQLPMLSWEEIRELEQLGWDIQSHSHRHYPQYQIPESQRWEEFAQSRNLLEQKLQKPVEFFCFPYGVFDEQASEIAAKAGYKAAMSSRPGTLPQNLSGPWQRLPRYFVDGLMDLQDFKCIFLKGNSRFMEIWHAMNRIFYPKFNSETPFLYIEKFKRERLYETKTADLNHCSVA